MEANLNQLGEYYPKENYQVSITKDTKRDFQGKTFFPISGATQYFSSVWQMIKQIEMNIIQNNFPKAAFEFCSWSKKAKAKKNMKEVKTQGKNKSDKVLCTLLIQIEYCRNATWQGTILWMEKRQAKTFRSQFEMVKLMEEAAAIM